MPAFQIPARFNKLRKGNAEPACQQACPKGCALHCWCLQLFDHLDWPQAVDEIKQAAQYLRDTGATKVGGWVGG